MAKFVVKFISGRTTDKETVEATYLSLSDNWVSLVSGQDIVATFPREQVMSVVQEQDKKVPTLPSKES